MSVYVDFPDKKLGRMLMCHMIADSICELHDMANRVGVDKRYFQDKLNKPHYDICKSKRGIAIKLGAIEVSNRKLVEILKNYDKTSLL